MAWSATCVTLPSRAVARRRMGRAVDEVRARQWLPSVGGEADDDGRAAGFVCGLLPGVGLCAALQSLVRDGVVPGLDLVDVPFPGRLDEGTFTIGVRVLGVVHAVPAVETAHLLVHGKPGEAAGGQGLGDGGLRGL